MTLDALSTAFKETILSSAPNTLSALHSGMAAASGKASTRVCTESKAGRLRRAQNGPLHTLSSNNSEIPDWNLLGDYIIPLRRVVFEEITYPPEGQQIICTPEIPQYYIELLEEKVMNEISRYLEDPLQVNHAF